MGTVCCGIVLSPRVLWGEMDGLRVPPAPHGETPTMRKRMDDRMSVPDSQKSEFCGKKGGERLGQTKTDFGLRLSEWVDA